MGDVGRTLSLTGQALRPGANLAHREDRLVPVDALIALGRATDPLGARLAHAKMGGEGVDQLLAGIAQTAEAIFANRGWPVHARKQTRETTMRRFTEQVFREFMGERCSHCKGHGVLGQKLDGVRRRLRGCATCDAAGFVLRSPSQGAGARKVRHICPDCRGKCYLQAFEELKAGKLKACNACAGSGVVLDGAVARGAALGFDHAYVVRVWAVRFNTVLAELRRIDRQTMYECAAFLFGEANDAPIEGPRP